MVAGTTVLLEGYMYLPKAIPNHTFRLSKITQTSRTVMAILSTLILAHCGNATDSGVAPQRDMVPPNETVRTLNQIESPKSFLARSGSHLTLAGQPYRFTGASNYRLAGGPSASQCYVGNHSAADYEKSLDGIFQDAAASGISVLRLWAFQSFAGASGRDFSNFDAVVSRAKQHGLRVILTLENQWKDCTLPGTTARKASWYAGEYAQNYGYALSFPDYVRAIVGHFKDEPTVAFWQIMNEAESTDAGALQRFAAHIAGLIKSIDSQHLVSFGTLACGQYGTDPANYRLLHADANIDILEAHDYGAENVAMPACLAANLQVAQALNKPFFIGESGIDASRFQSDAQRAGLFAAKMRAAAGAGVAGYLIWSYQLGQEDPQFGFNPGSQVANLVYEMQSTLFAGSAAPAHAPPHAPAQPHAPAHGPPAVAPAARPGPATAPRADKAGFACRASLTRSTPWALGSGHPYAASLDLKLEATGLQGLDPPYAVRVYSNHYQGLENVWNWSGRPAGAGTIAGSVTESWQRLVPGGRAATLGFTVQLDGQDMVPQQLSVGGVTCEIRVN